MMSHASRKTHENESSGIHDLPATRVRRSGRIYGGTGMAATPSAAADKSDNGSPTCTGTAAAGCVADSGLDRIFVRLECHDRAGLVVRPSARDVRAQAVPARRLQFEIAGWDLLDGRSRKYRLADLPGGHASPYDFSPGARVVGPLRWTWASATWKF